MYLVFSKILYKWLNIILSNIILYKKNNSAIKVPKIECVA